MNLKKILITFLVYFISLFICLGQNQSNRKDKEKLYYDDWPVTVESNANRKLISKDPNIDYVTVGTTWDHRIITYFFQNGTNDIDGNNEQQAIRDAFALWSVQTDLFFLQVCSADEADIAFSWGTFNHGDGGPFDGEGGILAHTLGGPPPNVFGDQAGDMHFDDSETWTLNTRSNGTQPIDLVTVAAHEIGHALGLDHTTVSGSLMLAVYNGSHRFLGSDDIAGIRYLYGQPGANLSISGQPIVCSSGASFTVNNPPPVDSIIWTCGPYLSLTSGQYTSSCNFSSTGNNSSWIRARLVTGCGSVVLQKTVWSGVPRVEVSGPSEGNTGGSYTFYANPAQGSQTTSYQWTLSPPYDGNYIYGYGDWANTSFNYSGGGYFQVGCTGHNNCGDGIMGTAYILISENGLDYIVSPNPASATVTISVVTAVAGTVNLPDINAVYDVSIHDMNGVLQSRNEYSGDSFTIPVNNLKDGNYLIRIDNGKSVSVKQLIINR